MVCPSMISIVQIAAARAELVIGTEIGVAIRSAVCQKPPLGLILAVAFAAQSGIQSRMNRGYVRHPHVVASGHAGKHRRDVVQDQLDYAWPRLLRLTIVEGWHRYWHRHDVRSGQSGLQRMIRCYPISWQIGRYCIIYKKYSRCFFLWEERRGITTISITFA